MSRCDADGCKKGAVWSIQEVTTLATLEEMARDGATDDEVAFSCEEDLGSVIEDFMDENPLHFLRIERIQ